MGQELVTKLLAGGITGAPKEAKVIVELFEYLKTIKRHAIGRMAVHIKISCLERFYGEEQYRRFIAACFRPFVVNRGAHIFNLPNHDVVLIVQETSPDDIEAKLRDIRHEFSESEFLKKITPVAGESDDFITWFDLGNGFPGFKKAMEDISEKLLLKITSAKDSSEKLDTYKEPKPILPYEQAEMLPRRPARKITMTAIEAPKRKIERRALNAELLHTLCKNIETADVSNLIRKQSVDAILPNTKQAPIMIHKWVPMAVLADKLMTTQIDFNDTWLTGYLNDVIAKRMLLSDPELTNERSLASSLVVTSSIVLSGAFNKFNQALGDQRRNNIILELNCVELTSNFSNFMAAREKACDLGFKVCIGGLDPRSLVWLNLEKLYSDFIKLKIPASGSDDWLSVSEEEIVRPLISKVGAERVILDGCETEADIQLGRRLGVSLFQGHAVSPVQAI